VVKQNFHTLNTIFQEWKIYSQQLKAQRTYAKQCQLAFYYRGLTLLQVSFLQWKVYLQKRKQITTFILSNEKKLLKLCFESFKKNSVLTKLQEEQKVFYIQSYVQKKYIFQRWYSLMIWKENRFHDLEIQQIPGIMNFHKTRKVFSLWFHSYQKRKEVQQQHQRLETQKQMMERQQQVLETQQQMNQQFHEKYHRFQRRRKQSILFHHFRSWKGYYWKMKRYWMGLHRLMDTFYLLKMKRYFQKWPGYGDFEKIKLFQEKKNSPLPSPVGNSSSTMNHMGFENNNDGQNKSKKLLIGSKVQLVDLDDGKGKKNVHRSSNHQSKGGIMKRNPTETVRNHFDYPANDDDYEGEMEVKRLKEKNLLPRLRVRYQPQPEVEEQGNQEENEVDQSRDNVESILETMKFRHRKHDDLSSPLYYDPNKLFPNQQNLPVSLSSTSYMDPSILPETYLSDGNRKTLQAADEKHLSRIKKHMSFIKKQILPKTLIEKATALGYISAANDLKNIRMMMLLLKTILFHWFSYMKKRKNLVKKYKILQNYHYSMLALKIFLKWMRMTPKTSYRFITWMQNRSNWRFQLNPIEE
jgi:hypothetical protein